MARSRPLLGAQTVTVGGAAMSSTPRVLSFGSGFAGLGLRWQQQGASTTSGCPPQQRSRIRGTRESLGGTVEMPGDPLGRLPVDSIPSHVTIHDPRRSRSGVHRGLAPQGAEHGSTSESDYAPHKRRTRLSPLSGSRPAWLAAGGTHLQAPPVYGRALGANREMLRDSADART